MNTEPLVRDETVTLDGLRFHYRDWGEPTAPPVVLLHAYLQHARTWDTIAKGLADRCRVLALDQRGFGESERAADYHELRLVADVAEFVDALGLGTCSLVGFSIGGSAAITYAQLYPDRVERLVAFECFTDPDVADDAPYRQVLLDHLTRLRPLPGRLSAGPAALARRLAAVPCPTLLLAGEESWMVEPTQRMARLNPRARS